MTIQSPPRAAREVALIRYPVGLPTEADFAVRDAPLGDVGEGDALLRLLLLSVDPAMRTWSSRQPGRGQPIPLGGAMKALGVAEVAETRNSELPSGTVVVGSFGLRSWHMTDGSDVKRVVPPSDRPLHTALGELGHIGLTAYVGLVDVARTQPGDCVLVSSAAGAVGAVACQIAKNLGASVVGIAGGSQKADWAKRMYGIDVVLDRHDPDLAETLRQHAPDGVDVFFDNTGGVIHDIVMEQMNLGGRIAICGTISVKSDDPGVGPRHERLILDRALNVQGFQQSRHEATAPEALERLRAWFDEGSLHLETEIVVGLDQAIPSLQRVLAGDHRGKILISPDSPTM